MKVTSLLLLLISVAPAMAQSIAWDNPPVMCPEDVFPKGFKCPDFSKVENPYTDFPDEFSREDIQDWKTNKAPDLKLCRNNEVLKREEAKIGSFSPATIEAAWMISDGGKEVKQKLNAITEASKKYGIPPHVLIGAMKQESLMASLGISPDGGNYSCGMSQLNIQEWCQAMNRLSESERVKLNWPKISCDSTVLPTNIVKPFYDLAVTKIGTKPTYQMTSSDFNGITFEQVLPGFPEAEKEIQDQRFQAISSFINNCQDITLSISFKAQTLKGLYDNFVPDYMKTAENYKKGKTFKKKCLTPYTASVYPLHTGWLMAVAMYNAGPVQRKLVEHYFQNDRPIIHPTDLIEALHWSGAWEKGTDFITFNDQNGNKLQQKWFKSCIVQRHVARVVQHVTAPNETIVKSLEQAPCTPTGVPEYRQTSPGVRLNK